MYSENTTPAETESRMKPKNPSPYHAPSFVLVGPLRAGTTLLHLMLNAHPDIASVGEFEEAVAILEDQGWPSLEHYRNWLDQHRVAVSRDYTLNQDADEYADLVSSMWDQLCAKRTEKIIGCTIHSRFDRIPELWPNTKFIHLIRDPRDVANSCVGMGWVGHPAKGSSIWIDVARRWETLADRIPSENWIQIKYEDLLEHPQDQLTQCCQLLGLSYHPEMLEFHKSSSYLQLDPKLAYQWKRKMNLRTAEIIDAACLPWMEKYNYEPSVPNPKQATRLESISITLHNRIARVRWRISRYGLGLVLKWAWVKGRPMLNPSRISTRKRIQEIDTAHLR